MKRSTAQTIGGILGMIIAVLLVTMPTIAGALNNVSELLRLVIGLTLGFGITTVEMIIELILWGRTKI